MALDGRRSNTIRWIWRPDAGCIAPQGVVLGLGCLQPSLSESFSCRPDEEELENDGRRVETHAEGALFGFLFFMAVTLLETLYSYVFVSS